MTNFRPSRNRRSIFDSFSEYKKLFFCTYCVHNFVVGYAMIFFEKDVTI